MRTVNACRVGDVDRVRAHISAGGNPNVFGLHRRTLLYHAVKNKHIAVCRMLLAAGASWDMPDQYGNTPADIARDLHIFNTSNDTR